MKKSLFVLLMGLMCYGCSMQQFVTDTIGSGSQNIKEIVGKIVFSSRTSNYSGVKISYGENITYTDSNGNFRLIINSNPNTNQLIISKDGYVTEAQTVVPTNNCVYNLGVWSLPEVRLPIRKIMVNITGRVSVDKYQKNRQSTDKIMIEIGDGNPITSGHQIDYADKNAKFFALSKSIVIEENSTFNYSVECTIIPNSNPFVCGVFFRAISEQSYLTPYLIRSYYNDHLIQINVHDNKYQDIQSRTVKIDNEYMYCSIGPIGKYLEQYYIQSNSDKDMTITQNVILELKDTYAIWQENYDEKNKN